MSNKSRSSSKRTSKASKQPGLLETLTRFGKRTAVVDEEDQATGTVIDLDSDDPYKYVDSQSLLPDDSDGSAATGTGLDDDDDFITTSLPKLTSAPPGPTTQHRKARDNPGLSGAGGVSTPKRSRVVGGATGSAKRKQTQKSKKSSVQQEEWSEEDMKRAIEASLQEKQREDRRQRQKMRESKVEEEEQLMLAHYQSMAAITGGREEEEWREGDDNGTGERDVIQRKLDDFNEQQQSPLTPSVASSTATPHQFKSASISIKKLNMKSLPAKKGKKPGDFLEEREEEEEDEGEVQIVSLQDEGETMAASGEAVSAASLTTSVKGVPKGMQRYCIEDEIDIAPDDDYDATPPILGKGLEAKREGTGGPQAIVSKTPSRGKAGSISGGDRGEKSEEAVVSKPPPSRGAPVTAAHSKKQPVSDGKAKSTKTGLSLKKGRKRLSDSGNSSLQELPHHPSSAQGPASKRPRVEASNLSDFNDTSKSSDVVSAAARPELTTNAGLPTNAANTASDMEEEVELAMNQAPPTEPSVGATASEMGSKDASDNGDMDRVAKETSVKHPPKITSLTGTEQIQEITRKGIDFSTNQKEKINDLRGKSLERREELTATCSSAIESVMEIDNAGALPSQARASLTLPTKVDGDRATKNTTAFELVRRVKADGWPPVKIQPSETPRHPSLRAPPGVLPADHTKVLIQCFNAYVTKLAVAQRKVLWRIKWGQPVVSSFNKAGVNSLTSGRRTRRSRATSIPYSEYALDLKRGGPSSSRSKSNSPMVSSKHSTPSKSPVSNIGQQWSPGDENDSDSDFKPSKGVTKRMSSRKSSLTAGAGKTTTTPTIKSQRATKSRLTLGKRLPPQLQEERADKSLSPGVQFDKSSLSPGIQFEREESPDILPPAAAERTHRESGDPKQKKLSTSATKSSGRRLEFGDTAEKSTLSVSPLPPSATTNESPRASRSASPWFQDGGGDVDNVLDLTSPSPPLFPAKPQEPTTAIDSGDTRSRGDDFMSSFNDGEKDTLIREKAVFSHTHISHDDSTDEEGHPQSVVTSAAATTTTVATSSSGSWLDSRKPPPSSQKTKSKRQPAKQTKNSKATAQSKKKAGNGRGGGGGKGRRQAKKTIPAALRMKALIEKSDSEGTESEHSSMEDGEGDSSGKETVPKKPPGGRKPRPDRRRTMDSTDDESEVTDMELGERGGGEGGEAGSSSGGLTSWTGSVGRGKGGKEVTGSNQGSRNLESVIDLTTESQVPHGHTSSPSPSPFPVAQSPTEDDDGCIPCPMCNKRFDSSVIQLHAEQCEGPESEDDHQWRESIITAAKTTTAAASAGGGGGRRREGGSGLSMPRKRQVQRETGRGGGRRKSYQPSLKQLMSKEREVRGEEEIDSDTTTADDDRLDPDVNLDDLMTSDGGGADPTASYYADTNLDWTERDESHRPSTTSIATAGASVSGGGAYRVGAGEREEGPRGGGGVFGRLSEDGEEGEGGFVIEPSPGSTPQPAEPMMIEDGEGGYIIDPSMISNSPIRCFTKLSEMDPQERAWYKDQFKAKSRGRGRGGGGGRRQLPMTREERESATWGRDDFGDLFGTDERSKGQGRRGGRGRGGYGGRKYDWNRVRSRGKGRGRGRGRGRAGSKAKGRNF